MVKTMEKKMVKTMDKKMVKTMDKKIDIVSLCRLKEYKTKRAYFEYKKARQLAR